MSHRERIFMVHGINSDPARFDAVRETLAPHFDCVVAHYEGFDYRADDATTSALGRLLNRSKAFVKAVFGLRARAQALDVVRRQYEKASSGYRRLHLIAHSFGTVLSAELMTTSSFVRFDRVILAGSPLPRRFPWHQIRSQVGALRNEVGRKDAIVWLAGLASLHPRFGVAGLRGFIGLHTIRHPLDGCDACAAQPATADAQRGHNVALGDYGHSSMFLSHRHATDLWLPWLWGFVPKEYLDFLENARQAIRHHQDGVYVHSQRSLEAMAAWCWGRYSGPDDQTTFGEFILLQLELTVEQLGLTLDPELRANARWLVLYGVADAVTNAADQMTKPFAQRDIDALRALDPGIAAARAVAQFIQELPS